ncbi:MAG: FliH/SctL family protein [Candidatus Wallbacteria bacterium]|nr:FliH/SctL family protein [Candidatus Wallbacteria bacterium]
MAPKVIKLDNIINQRILVGSGSLARPMFSEEEKLNHLHRQLEEAERQLEKLRSESSLLKEKSEREAREIVTKARQFAEEQLKNSDALRKKASEESTILIKQSSDEAQKKAYADGLLKGQEEGYQEGIAKTAALIEEAGKLLESINNSRDQIIFSLKDDLCRLITSYVRRIIKIELKLQPEIIISNISAALAKTNSKENITVILSEEDYDLILNHSEKLRKIVKGILNIKYLKEPNLKSGGCIVETDYGSIDATIEGQFHELQKTIYKALDKDIAPAREEL